MKKDQRGQHFIMGGILFVLLWWMASVQMAVKALPSPVIVIQTLPELMEKGLLLHIGASLKRLGLGMLIALGIGMSVGLIMGRCQRINRVLSPLVYFTYPIPKTALLPIIMLLGGLGESSKIMLVVLITVFPIMLAVRDATIQVDESLEHVLTSLGASSSQKLYHVILPAICPSLLTQLRLAIGTALSVLFFAENYGTKYGLGYYIQDCWARMDYIGMYGGILTLSLVGLLLFVFIDSMERVICRG